ncbi:hypothetical protein RhiirA4_481494 [Rhizophagus irregularis]|uniref:MULE transposase domain-containing protein n=1 Tax=Rhizophagus irregularis TaxID=588596 RepID=A0A2I1HJJ9_9GLOM|nr:hypothetical protein RhiirA4_481494 [Rhizophagus irregularis]
MDKLIIKAKQVSAGNLKFAKDNDIELKPQSIITDFELAAINVLHSKFPDINNKGCYFHLCQNGWRQIQRCGLAIQYENDEHFSIMNYIIVLIAANYIISRK